MRGHSEIEALLAELLHSGVSPKYVSRLAVELEDHFADLECEAKRLGVPESELAADAQMRLGASAVIAGEFARRPELKSLLFRSRLVEQIVRALIGGYLVLTAPMRIVVAGHTAMLRYTAATAAGASVTSGILLLLTLMLSPDSPWGARMAATATVALGGRDVATVRERAAVEPARAPQTNAPVPEPVEETRAAPVDRRLLREATPPALPLMRAPDARMPAAFSLLSGSHDSPQYDLPRMRAVIARMEPALFLGVADRELRPILATPPSYPWAAARRGLEGFVLVEYTVTRDGAVADPVVVESSSWLFDKAALEAASGFRYRPRVIGGTAVDVRGVRTLIRFELEI
jgi:TonB family protein